MIALLSSLPGIILSIGAIIAIVVVGVLYVAGIWKKEKDGQDDRLISILKQTVDTLEKKVDDQKKTHDELITSMSTKLDALTKKVDVLESENMTLTKVLQGRDDQTQVFYKKAFEAMDTANKTFALVETMNKNHRELMTTLVEHLKPGVTINNQPASPNQPPNSLIT